MSTDFEDRLRAARDTLPGPDPRSAQQRNSAFSPRSLRLPARPDGSGCRVAGGLWESLRSLRPR